MKLKDEFKKLPKEMVYEMYEANCYNPKDYDNISRVKMLDEIVKEESQEKFMYCLCTQKELEFLKYISNHELKENDLKKYNWEIETLNDKCIFSKTAFDVFEEQKENVEKTLEYYKNHKKNKENDDFITTFIIGVVRTNGNILTNALKSLIMSLFSKMESDYFEALLSHPLIHYYCSFYMEYIPSLERKEEMVYYRKYYDFLDDLNIMRQEIGIAGSIPVNINDYPEMFYYGMPISNEKVKKLYNVLNKDSISRFNNMYMVEEARLLGNRFLIDTFVTDNKLKEVMYDALDEMPCAAMNGFTPKQYEKEKETEEELDIKFTAIPQNNAHLCKSAADEYYKIFFALLEYTNNLYKIDTSVKEIKHQEKVDPNKISKISDYLFDHKEILDDFIKENKYNFNKEELDIVDGFKSAVKDEYFVIVGYEREYTEILSRDGKIYMVKGVRDDIDKIVNYKNLPLIVGTTLLMFKGNIIYNSLMYENSISFGNDVKSEILKDYNNAMRYYHL